MQEKTKKEMSVASLIAIWDRIDWDKVNLQRAYKIWDEFSNKVRAALFTTSNFNKFIDVLCKKLSIDSLSDKLLNEIFNMDNRDMIMNYIRDNLQAVILEMRLNLEIRKEQREIIKEKKNNEN